MVARKELSLLEACKLSVDIIDGMVRLKKANDELLDWIVSRHGSVPLPEPVEFPQDVLDAIVQAIEMAENG